MICLCERDMTCLGGKLEHCRVLVPHEGTKRPCPSLENQTRSYSLTPDSPFTQLQSTNSTLHFPIAYKQQQSCLKRRVSSSATQISRISLTCLPLPTRTRNLQW